MDEGYEFAFHTSVLINSVNSMDNGNKDYRPHLYIIHLILIAICTSRIAAFTLIITLM